MSTSRLKSRFCSALLVLLLAVAAGTLPTPGTAAVETAVDLDGNPTNGAESSVETRVLQTYPVKIENVVHNNALGVAFRFDWDGAGPGGFDSYVTPGPGVGTKWEWTTVSQVYTIQTPLQFARDSRGLPAFGGTGGGIQPSTPTSGSVMVPGKSIFPTQVTVSSASLTSSLITFFSPERTVATCQGTFEPGRFEQTITNNSNDTLTLMVEEQDCCPEPQMTICEDGCQFYLTDVNNCGGCGIECAFDEFCDTGSCEPICPPGQSLCGEFCVDQQQDVNNCGGCGIECAFDEFCDAGSCEPICPSGQSLCGETCVDLQADVNNCGGCGTTCAFDEFCDAGACEPICPSGQELCGETCADLFNDASNCGGCGVQCAFDEYCSAGSCTLICPLGQTLCGSVCVDLLADPLNCGACGNVCGFNSVCNTGACFRCRPPQQTACGNSCVNIHTDPFNCGACGNACNFTDCPSSGQGTCSQGASCICEDGSPAESMLRTTVAPRPRSAPLRERTTARPVAAGSRRDTAVRSRSAIREAAKSALAPEGSSIEAPVCSVAPLQQTIAPGESFTQCIAGALVGKEIFTRATVEMDGEPIAEGPCALIVPDPDAAIGPVLLSPTSVVLRDTSGDGLCQPGETCDVFVSVQNLGSAALLAPIATLSSPPDEFNARPITLLSASSPYPDFPAYSGAGDCETPAQLDPKTNQLAFSFTLPADQEADIGRVFNLNFSGNGDDALTVDVPLVLGVGKACNPQTDLDGESYDGLNGFLSPVGASLVPAGSPVNYASGTFSLTRTIPLKLQLSCGSRLLAGSEIEINPEILRLEHATLGPQPLTTINGDNNANPSNPFFACGTSRCEYQLRTRDLPTGQYVISVRLPDSRVFEAGFTIVP